MDSIRQIPERDTWITTNIYCRTRLHAHELRKQFDRVIPIQKPSLLCGCEVHSWFVQKQARRDLLTRDEIIDILDEEIPDLVEAVPKKEEWKNWLLSDRAHKGTIESYKLITKGPLKAEYYLYINIAKYTPLKVPVGLIFLLS